MTHLINTEDLYDTVKSKITNTKNFNLKEKRFMHNNKVNVNEMSLFDLPVEIKEKINISEKECLAFYKRGISLKLLERDSRKYYEKSPEEIKDTCSYLDEFITMTIENLLCFKDAYEYYAGILEDLKAISGLIDALGCANITQIYIEKQQDNILNEMQKRAEYAILLKELRACLSSF